MRTPSKLRIRLASLVLLMITLFSVAGTASAQDGGPNLEIPVPGVEFSGIIRDKEITIPWLGQYVAGIYSFLISIVGLFAATVIIFGGFQYVTAAGDKAKIGAAKKRMVNAMIGLLLAFGSYTILYTINPELTRFEGLQVGSVKTELMGSEDHNDGTFEAAMALPSPIKSISVNGFTSSLALAKKDRKIPFCETGAAKPCLDFSLFGTIDFAVHRTRAIADITGFVVHNGGWNAAGNVHTWTSNFQDKGKGSGTHYTIDRDGTIYQHISEDGISVHGNGANKTSIGAELTFPGFIPDGTKKRISCNEGQVLAKYGAEAVRKACSPTEQQYAAIKALLNDIVTRTKVKIDKEHIIGHCEAVGSTHGDPRAFDWSKIGISNDEKKAQLEVLKKTRGKATPCQWYLPF